VSILVADEDCIVVTLIARLLRSKGHEVVAVFDAMQAIMFAMRMPTPEAIKRLKSSLNTAMIPVIVLSGTTDPQMPGKVKALGADAFLSKPVDPAALFAALAEVLPAPPG
jgi:CheY-like chemotaxis protein